MLAAVCLAIPGLRAQDLTGGPPEAVRTEIRYAQALQRLGLPDDAQIVLERISREHPEAAPFLKVIKLEGLVAVGRFADVIELIAAEPDPDSQGTWAMKLALADGYYAWGKYEEARAIYEDFFKKYAAGPPPTLNDFYINSAYKYAQMLRLMGESEAAIKAYNDVLKAKLERHVERQVMAEIAELTLKLAEEKPEDQRPPLVARARELAEKLLWSQDLWFGKAIVILAHAHVMENNIDGAMELVEDYKGQLRQIDDILREQAAESGEDLTKLSPMAECRYLLGVMLQERAAKLLEKGGSREQVIQLLAGKAVGDDKRTPGALQHFLNVFVGYPGTSWAPDAGVRAEVVENILRDRFGATIKKHVTREQMEKVKSFQFQGARTLYNQQQFALAVDAYIKVLNLFPEGGTSVAALGELARCYVEVDDELHVDMTARYVAERWGAHPELLGKAGDQVLRVAESYSERGNTERADAIYDLYFTRFKTHPLAPALLFQFGERQFGEGNYDRALTYYERIASNYTNAPVHVPALKKITFCHLKRDDLQAEIKALDAYAGRLALERKPGADYIEAKFRLASSFQKLGGKHIPDAYRRYDALLKLLAEPGSRYQETDEDAQRNRDILQAVLFYKAVCLSQLTKPEAKLAAYKRHAIKTLEDLVERFPDGKFAPPALSQVGTLWTVLEKPDQTREAIDRLQDKYPDSVEARNALFMLGNSLLQMGMRRQAVDVFRQMFTGEGAYSDTQILTAGDELLKAGEYALAGQAFDRVLARAEKRAYLEPAMLGSGRALVMLEDYERAAAVLADMLSRYPGSALTVEASLNLSRACAELAMREPDADKRFDRFNEAVTAMKTARKYDDSPEGRARSDVGIGRILMLKAEAEETHGTPAGVDTYRREAIAALQGLMMFGDEDDAAVRPYIEQAFSLCLPLLVAIERWQDVVDDADRYIELFPNGPSVSEVRRFRSRANTKLKSDEMETDDETPTE